MEGVPRVPMLSFPMRRSADTPNFKSRLRNFISGHYNEEPDSYANEIHELESLRASAVHVSKDYSGCSTLKKYFCQLNFLKSRFPMNDSGSCAISFSWYDVFSETVHGWSDVDFEMSCVLYNIGALHSELGALDNRQTADGMKTSCTHFQCAAWAFNHLRHNYQKFFTPDVSPDMLNILNNICLAQAQECILEKSLIDNRKSTITAKVALQIVEYYSTALRIIDGMLKDAAQYSDKLIKSVKKWRKLVELKVHYYGCIAYLYRGMQAEDQSKWGERVTMYKAAAEKMNECTKLGKNLEKTDPVHDTLHFTQDVVGGKVTIAEKENEFIYHEKVPELETVMSDVKAVSLVKGIQFKFDDPQVAGPDIFGRLVPMEAHEASSLYSEEKAKILRTYSRKIEEKNEALDKFILPLQLDHLELHDTEKIPQELIDCCAALSVNQDVVKRLSELMSSLSGLFHDVEANLEEIQDHLVDQEKREKEYQEVVGKRPPNNIIHEISKEFEKYQSAQSVAAESNKTLHDQMVLHVSNLTILMKPLNEVMKHIPKFDELERNEEALERMKKLAGKVGEMRKQREMLESQLRDSILNDDITKSLVVKKDEDLETVFKEELQKHDKITQVLDQNLLAQENIIRALTEANAEYAETRRATVELKKKRDSAIQSFLSSYDAYDELTSKCNKGIEFYTKLNTNVEKLLQRTRSVCKVQNEERDINMERIIRKAQNPPSVPSVTLPTSMGHNMVSQGYYSGYPQTSMPPVPAPATYPTPSSPSRPSQGGTHLKLKDYLAMKKEGLTTNEMMSVMNNIPTPAPSSYDATLTGPSPGLQHPSTVSSAPTPPLNQSMGVRPAPVDSEDVGKDLTACKYANPHQQPLNMPAAHMPQQQPYNNYSYYTPPPTGNTNHTAYADANSSAYYNQSYSSPVSSPAVVAPPQQPMPPPKDPYQSQKHFVSETPMPTVQPEYHAPLNNHQRNYQELPQQQQQPPLARGSIAAPSVPGTTPMPSYLPNQAGLNTSTYATTAYPSQPSGQYPAFAGTTSTDMSNTSTSYSPSYGVPQTYSGATPYQQSIAPSPAVQYTPAMMPAVASTPTPAPSAPSATPAPATSFYSPAYQPTANTATNATYSTGTTATAAAAPPSLQHQQQQLPQGSVDSDSSYSQTSFLAQYVRQNQGYLSSATAPGTNIPSSSYASQPSGAGAGGFLQQQQVSYPQQGYSAPVGPGPQANQYTTAASAATGGQQHQWQQQSGPPPPTSMYQNSYLQRNQGQQVPSASGYPPQVPQQQYPYGQPQQLQQPQEQVQSGYYNVPSQQQQAPPQPYQQPPQPSAPVAVNHPQRASGSTNLDLLSEVDFHALPAVEPLAPVILPPSMNPHPQQPENGQKNHVDDSMSSKTSQTAISHTTGGDVATISGSGTMSAITVSSAPSNSNSPTVSPSTTSAPQSQNGVFSKAGSVVTPDPFLDPVALEKFTFEVEKFEKTVEGLSKKSLSEPTMRLDLKWKELLDIQNATSVQRSISVARCYPMKNRFPDIMPYDQTRVPIPDTKDDYINASFLNGLSLHAYPLIATQAPLPSTMADFWHMIWQHYIELVVCLSSDIDLKEHTYWPQQKGACIEHGPLKIVLQTNNNKGLCVERILTISHRDLKQSRVVVHLQFNGWTGHTFPVSPGPFIGFINEVSSYYRQQRNLSHPVVVHCVSGVGKTGIFSVLSAAIQEIDGGHGIPDLLQVAGIASEKRKGIMNDKEYFRFAYHALLYYCQDILLKRGILSAKPTFEEKPTKSHIRHPSQDFLQDISLKKLLDHEQSLKVDHNKRNLADPTASSSSLKSSPVHSARPERSSSLADVSDVKPKLNYSDVPESLTNIDPTTFQINCISSLSALDDAASKKKQAFENGRGALIDRTASVGEDTKDPLSSLDPMWTMKK